MKIKYKYWRIDGSCVVGGDNVALHYFPILSTPSSPVVVVSLSFLPYVFHNNVFRNTIFPTSLPSLPAGGGKHDSRWRENVDIRLSTFFFYERSSSISSIVSPNGIWIYFHSLFYYKEREGGGDEKCEAAKSGWNSRRRTLINSLRGDLGRFCFSGLPDEILIRQALSDTIRGTRNSEWLTPLKHLVWPDWFELLSSLNYLEVKFKVRVTEILFRN